MLIRWIFTLFCALIFCFCIFLLKESHQNVLVKQDYIKRLEQRKQDLLRWRDQHLRLQEKLREWNSFWHLVENSELKPEKWQDYPVQIRGKNSPQQASQIVILLSNDISTGNQFWFAPSHLQVQPRLEEYDQDGQTRERQVLQLQLQGKIMTN